METPLNVIKPISIKYLIKWFDEVSFRWITEDISEQDYVNLAITNPLKPTSYTKTDWQNTWEKNGAIALGGRVVFDTPNGNTKLGDIQELEDGSLMLYFDDMDNGYMVQLLKKDFIGILPNISLKKPIIIGGQFANITNGILIT